jgi:hypothetical protein
MSSPRAHLNQGLEAPHPFPTSFTPSPLVQANATRRAVDLGTKIGCPSRRPMAIRRAESVALGNLHYSPRFCGESTRSTIFLR